MLLTSSRSYDLIIPERKNPVKALVPMIDMINFGLGYPELPHSKISVLKKDNEFFEFKIHNTFKENTQVSIYYIL